MGRPNQFNNFIRRYNNGKAFTEATATTALSRWLYRGHGTKHLSLPVCEDGVGRPAGSGPRRFSCPTEGRGYSWWKPFQDHLQGDHKGLVIDDKTTSAPFVAVDIDRHSGGILGADHQRVVIEAGQYLTSTCPHLKWMAEINPKNGSAKFFGFRRTGEGITKRELQKLSSTLRDGLIQRGLCHNHNVEVFGDNCHAIWLPLRRDKIGIGDDGRVHRCKRKIIDPRYYPERVFEEINVYSALYLMAWIDHGENYHEPTLVRALRHSCCNLKDEISADETSVFCSSPHDGIVPSPAARGHAAAVPVRVQASTHQSNFEGEPNAFAASQFS